MKTIVIVVVIMDILILVTIISNWHSGSCCYWHTWTTQARRFALEQASLT